MVVAIRDSQALSRSGVAVSYSAKQDHLRAGVQRMQSEDVWMQRHDWRRCVLYRGISCNVSIEISALI